MSVEIIDINGEETGGVVIITNNNSRFEVPDEPREERPELCPVPGLQENYGVENREGDSISPEIFINRKNISEILNKTWRKL